MRGTRKARRKFVNLSRASGPVCLYDHLLTRGSGIGALASEDHVTPRPRRDLWTTHTMDTRRAALHVVSAAGTFLTFHTHWEGA